MFRGMALGLLLVIFGAASGARSLKKSVWLLHLIDDKTPTVQFYPAAFKLGRHVFFRSGAKTQNRQYGQS